MTTKLITAASLAILLTLGACAAQPDGTAGAQTSTHATIPGGGGY